MYNCKQASPALSKKGVCLVVMLRFPEGSKVSVVLVLATLCLLQLRQVSPQQGSQFGNVWHVYFVTITTLLDSSEAMTGVFD